MIFFLKNLSEVAKSLTFALDFTYTYTRMRIRYNRYMFN